MDTEKTSRRTFLFSLGIAINAIAVALFAIPILGYVLSPARRFTWLDWIQLGSLIDYPENQTRLAEYINPFKKAWDGETAKIPCWVRRMTGDQFQVFAINCTHLGCPVRWFAESELFMCPCHGGVFYSDGRHASGPPPRALYQYKYKVESGQALDLCRRIADPGKLASVIELLKSVGRWLDARLQVGSTIAEVAAHPVPRSSASWWYIFGSATLVVFILQVVTGICLATVYTPAADRAWDSLIYLNYQQPLGWYLRALHGWGSNFMVALMFVHMIQVFLFGAYKFPRELTWVAGCFLLLCTLGMAFTGQVLRFDQNAYWGLGIGASIAGRTPIIGFKIVDLILGGPIIAGETLSRFFALHVFVIPALLIGFVGLHLFLVLRLGINEWPMPGRIVRRNAYIEQYHELVEKDGEPFMPFAAQKDLVFAGLIILSLLVVAAVEGPIGPNGQPDPTIIQTVPRPDFFFLWLFSLFALLPPWTETFLMLTGPVAVIGLLFALPFLSGTGEKSWHRRPFSVVIVILVVTIVGTLTWLGTFSPWSPVMDAWSAAPTPIDYVKGRTPLELQGALLVQSKQCRNCHSLGGQGGMRGPALDDTAARLTRDQIVRQIIQGGGNMPAYGKNMTPAEVNALVAFLATMHPPGEPPARDSARPASPASSN